MKHNALILFSDGRQYYTEFASEKRFNRTVTYDDVAREYFNQSNGDGGVFLNIYFELKDGNFVLYNTMKGFNAKDVFGETITNPDTIDGTYKVDETFKLYGADAVGLIKIAD